MAINSLIVQSGMSNPGPFRGLTEGREARQNHLLRDEQIQTAQAQRNALVASQPLQNYLLGQQVAQNDRDAQSYDEKRAAQSLYPHLSRAAEIQDPAQSRRYLAEVMGAGMIDREDAADLQSMFGLPDDVFSQALVAARDKTGSLAGALDNTGRMVQSSQVLENGNLALVLRNGQIVDTGQKAKDTYRPIEVAGGMGAFSTRGGNITGILSTPEQETRAATDRASAVTAATDTAKLEVKREAERPQMEANIGAAQDRTALVDQFIDTAIDQTGWLSAGPAQQVTGWVGGTPAANLSFTLDQVRSNIGFEQLQAMRDASPTGGALGQVTERELEFLQSVLGSIDPRQSPDQLRRNLEIVRQAYKGVASLGMDVYLRTYGDPRSGMTGGDEAGQGSDIDDLLQKYGGQ